MEFTIRAGAEVDIATTSELNAMGASLMDAVKGNKRPLPRYLTVMGSGSSGSSGATPFAIFVGTPPIGFMWDVEAVVAVGSNDSTIVPGTVALYAGPVTIGNLRLPLINIPEYKQVGERRIWVQGGQELWANIAGVANNTPVNVLVSVAEWRAVDVIEHGAP
jgi:hypothetical protein